MQLCQYLHSALQSIPACHGIQELLGFPVLSFSHQIERCLGELPTVQENWRGAEGEDNLVEPPDSDQVTDQRDHHDANRKCCMHVHGRPCPHFAACELGNIHENHH